MSKQPGQATWAVMTVSLASRLGQAVRLQKACQTGGNTPSLSGFPFMTASTPGGRTHEVIAVSAHIEISLTCTLSVCLNQKEYVELRKPGKGCDSQGYAWRGAGVSWGAGGGPLLRDLVHRAAGSLVPMTLTPLPTLQLSGWW